MITDSQEEIFEDISKNLKRVPKEKKEKVKS